MTNDPRTLPVDWPAQGDDRVRRRARLMLLLAVPLALFYVTWLLAPGRAGQPELYALLVAAELFNLTQAAGFWWTCAGARRRRPLAATSRPAVDVLIPTYDEPVDVVEPTVAAAVRMGGGDVRVWLLDDGDRREMCLLAARHGAHWITRAEHTGAKAGNINHALPLLDAPYVVVLDCDHVPEPHFLEATLGHFEADDRVGLVQTPQYYANWGEGPIADASWAQQALFFGAIAQGKDGHGAMFCCGTNVVFRRDALLEAGGFPTGSLTEDFELSIGLHERGWRTAYVPEVVAKGLGPEDMASYVSQQQRWARGCLTGMKAILRARLPWRLRLQFALSSLYFLTGWTVVVYMAMPVVRILTGAQPLGAAGADQFLVHFAPYFGFALMSVAIMGGGTYSFRAYALATASFWIHVQATVLTLLGRRGTFVVTPKSGTHGRQLKPVWPVLAVVALLVSVAAYGLVRDQSPGTLNNVAFALLHVTVLLAGVWAAVFPPHRPSLPEAAPAEVPAPDRELVAA